MEAIRTLRRIRTSGEDVGAEYLYHLTLLATGDQNQADEAASAVIAAKLRAGLTPG